MRVKIFNRIIILLCMILLLSGCGQKTNTFPQIEDLSLFGSSVKEAGKLLGINLLDISPTISENSEQLEVYQLPGTWMIGEGEAEVSLHFLTTSTPKGNPMGLEMVTMEFSEGTDLKKLWEYISETWNLKDNPDWDKDERGNVQEFSWMSEPLDAETTEKLEKISEETFGNSMIYVMPYIYMEGRIRKDGSVLGEISTYLNFSSQSYFISIFKRYTGITPGQYRKLHRQISW